MARPRIGLSRCFLEPVRYNGEAIDNDLVKRLKDHVEFLNLCPEVDIGLGVPRNRIIIVKERSTKRVIQPETGLDITERMLEYVRGVCDSFSNVDGFLLKAKSPSCGVSSTKIYRDGSVAGRGNGIFAEELKRRFPHLPVEDEMRLGDPEIRRHFLTRIFAFSELREFLSHPDPEGLVELHSRYKFLLMVYNQKILKKLSKILLDQGITFDEKVSRYSEGFYKAFLRRPSIKGHVRTLRYLLSKRLGRLEKRHLLYLIERINSGRIGLRVVTEFLKGLANPFEGDYLGLQRYIEPYPPELEG